MIHKVKAPDGSIIKVEAPDDAKSEDLIKFAQSNYEKAYPQLALDAGESARPLQVVRDANPDKRPDYMAQHRQDVADLNEYERGVHAKGPAAYARMLESRDMDFGEKAAIVAGRETDKLLAGAADVGDFIQDVALPSSPNPETYQNETGMTGNKYFDMFNKYSDMMKKGPMERTTQRAEDQVTSDRLYEEFDEEAGLASVAAMAPYMLSGFTAGPAASKLSKSVIDKTIQGAETAYKGGKGLLTQGVEKLAATGNPVGKKMKMEWTDPLRKRGIRKANTRKEPIPWREGFLSDTLGGGLVGAAEGGFHYDNNPIEGAIAGMGGASAGRLIKPLVTRKAPVYSQADQQIIDYARQQGFKYFPGGQSGDVGQQMFESGLRSDKHWGESMARVDRNNAIVMNEKAYEAMGIPKGSIPQLSPEKLDAHIKGLQTEYDDLVNNSTARFSGKSIQDLRDSLDSLALSKSKAGEEAYFAAQNQFDEILERLHATRDKKTGKFLPATFGGKDYQDMSRYIKDEISVANKAGNDGVVRALKPFQKALDDAMDNGINYGGKVTSAQWKDLNERYAMSRMLIDNGMDMTGKFDPQKFGTYLMSKDAYRTLTEKGGRIVPLQKLAKANFLSSQHAGSDMTGTGLGSNKITKTQAFLSSPFGKMLPMIDDIYLGLYKRGWPANKGLLNMSGKGFGDTTLYSKAQAQGQQQHPTAVKLLKQGKNWANDKVVSGLETMDETLTDLEKFRMSLFD